jgi:hypothetical protein
MPSVVGHERFRDWVYLDMDVPLIAIRIALFIAMIVSGFYGGCLRPEFFG